MPARGYPLDIDALILFELAREAGSGPDILRRVRRRMQENGYKLNYGSWYPALKRLERKGLVSGTLVDAPERSGRARRAKVYVLTEEGKGAAQALSTVIRNLILPLEASA